MRVLRKNGCGMLLQDREDSAPSRPRIGVPSTSGADSAFPEVEVELKAYVRVTRHGLQHSTCSWQDQPYTHSFESRVFEREFQAKRYRERGDATEDELHPIPEG